jgi:flagellar basal-body rod protein FlgC
MSISALKIMDIAADGLSAQRLKMNAVSENIANAETTRTEAGGPYRRQRVIFSENTSRANFQSELQTARLQLRRTREGHGAVVRGGGAATRADKPAVEAATKADPPDKVRLVFDPSHPDANEDGYVAMPDIDIITEMVDLMSATRAYEANLTTVEAAKGMVDKALDI